MPTSMANVIEALAPTETSPSTELLATSARTLVDHLSQSVGRLRHLRLSLDADPTDVEARRVLGAEFESAGRALAVAQSFETSITELADGPITVSALLNDETIGANMATWFRSVDDAHRLVIADLTAIDAIASSLPVLDSPSDDTRHIASELIAALARNAIDRLDIAHPALDQAADSQ